MPRKIRLLSDQLVNQIAAGEVVQRPASVVKELIDNALDAGSSSIKIIIKEGGKQLIQIIDNGIGMDEVDARMSFEKHATSKISKKEDLFNIQTMGFRGEALPSIAGVSQLEMATCLRGEEIGTEITIDGGCIKQQEAAATPEGTKISVKNLFYNIPARRNFLKFNAVEMRHIIETFQRAALSQPEVAFSLYQNETEIYQLPASRLSHRIIHLFGEGYKKQLIHCEETTNFIKITGYIGKPEHAKKTRGEQFFFVNQRFIKSSYLHHAVKSAFEGFNISDLFPFYVIFIEVDPSQIDVNVHPAKTEIKFEDDRTVYAMLAAVIKKGLAIHHIAPSLDFEQNINFSPLQLESAAKLPTVINKATRNYMQFKGNNISTTSLKSCQQLFKPLDDEIKITKAMIAQHPTSLADNATLETNPLRYETTLPALQLYNTYIITQVKSGVLLIDQNRAHKRTLYDKFIMHLQSKSSASQQLLMPEHLVLNPADFILVITHKELLRSLGFIIEIFGKNSVVISGSPVTITNYAPKQLLEDLIEQFKWNKEQLALTVEENIARALAKRASLPAGKQLTAVEISSLLAQLFSSTNINYAPNGRKIFVLLSQGELAALF